LKMNTADEVSRYVNRQLIDAGLERVVPSRQVG
jgi:hypothetical protein